MLQGDLRRFGGLSAFSEDMASIIRVILFSYFILLASTIDTVINDKKKKKLGTKLSINKNNIRKTQKLQYQELSRIKKSLFRFL